MKLDPLARIALTQTPAWPRGARDVSDEVRRMDASRLWMEGLDGSRHAPAAIQIVSSQFEINPTAIEYLRGPLMVAPVDRRSVPEVTANNTNIHQVPKINTLDLWQDTNAATKACLRSDKTLIFPSPLPEQLGTSLPEYKSLCFIASTLLLHPRGPL
ncbi:hypothetical protein BV22DRAFT_223912 [Leucogyrophana mollusca]|uniref:Uncharacterized protein n=1 Tax=Leucogyrophana mollusca TaxID=85980 RepID=A0ACB8BTK1_9AGAM|nr:hypothetical protein BV22DRAFT_223912 [Leucogyrophana mollusca]